MTLTKLLHRSVILLLLGAAIGTPVRAAESYREPHRPQFHFTPAKNWMNDPNGMVYYEGEYHLFYQHNPFGEKWGHMSWGHAVSKDMVHWEHLPIALYEETNVMIFSGSAVIDWKNTSGFGQNGKPPMVAIYTGHHTKRPLQNQHIAYSNDKGRTWTKYAGNPVLDIGEKDFRDPKVIWHEATKQWVMVIAWPDKRQVRFYASPDLKAWTHLSDFGPAGGISGVWECPDLFPLPIEGSRKEQKWVLIVSVSAGAPAGGTGCQYYVGDFDGKTFTLDASYPQQQPEFVPPGKVLADFEGDDYGAWKVTGDAFGTAPARGKIDTQQPVEGFRGRGLVNTYINDDKTTGTLTSPEFEVTHDFVNFLIGGGNHARETCVNLLVEGRVVRTTTGDAAERLTWKSWPVQEFRGRKARIEIVDSYTAGWGHINVDHIMLADQPARTPQPPALWADFGADFYAAVSWSDVPARDGRRLWLGWMSGWPYANDVPTAPWRSAMTIPREVVLRRTAEGLRMAQVPVKELKKLRGKNHRLRTADFAEANEWLGKRQFKTELLEIRIELAKVTAGADFGLKIMTGAGEETVLQRTAQGILSVDRTRSGKVDFNPAFPGIHEAPLPITDGRTTLHLFLDTSSLEVFGNDGEVVLTDLILPTSNQRNLQFISGGQSPQIKRIDIWELRSAW